jgi:hypothetical protein
VDRVHAAWTGGAARVHGGPEAVQTKCTVARRQCEACELSGRWCSPATVWEDEEDAVRPMVGSLEHEWRR